MVEFDQYFPIGMKQIKTIQKYVWKLKMHQLRDENSDATDRRLGNQPSLVRHRQSFTSVLDKKPTCLAFTAGHFKGVLNYKHC